MTPPAMGPDLIAAAIFVLILLLAESASGFLWRDDGYRKEQKHRNRRCP